MTQIMWRMDELEQVIEIVLLNRIKVIGHNDQTYNGYPSILIKELAFAIDEYLRSNKV